MPITAKELVEMQKLGEEIEEEIAGIRTMIWDLGNAEENVKIVNHRMEVLFTHIQEELSRINEIKKKMDLVEDALRKQSIDLSGTPLYELYEGSKTINDSLSRIIGILAVQLDALSHVTTKLCDIVRDVRKFGIEKMRIEGEMEALREMRETMKAFMQEEVKVRREMWEVERKNYFEALSSFERKISDIFEKLHQTLASLIELKAGINVNELTNKIRDLEEKISNIESKMYEQQVSVPITQIRKSQLPLFDAMEKLVREEGITDKMQMVERLRELGYENITPRKILAYGFKDLVKRYSQIKEEEVKEEEEIEE